MYGLSLRPPAEIAERMAQSQPQQEHFQEVCGRYSAASYKLKRMVEGATHGPILPVFPVAFVFAWGGPKHAELVVSAVSALTVVPFIMKLPMRKASYGRRAAVGNGVLALLGAAYGHQQARKKQKRVCGKVE